MKIKILQTAFLAGIFITFIQAQYPAYSETVSLSKTRITVLFSPQDDCAREIVSAIDKAEKYVYVAMYYFTSRPIAQALVSLKERGVDVRVCLDGEQPGYEYSKSRYLENNDIDIRLVNGSGIMHNKFCIIDDYVTITGSYNWTARADLENDENLIFIESREIARIYKAQFLRYWSGDFIDTCTYKDEERLEKSPAAAKSAKPGKGTVIEKRYVASVNSTVFHDPDCPWAKRIKEENKIWFKSRNEALDKGYTPCKVCNP
jgi:phosphatidylserine/phosphatidylglycerophosphate/cardiolipin synthase-like enzyme